MSVLYLEPTVGVTAYPAAPQVSASGAFEPGFHVYRGATNSDYFFSYDGVHDHGRIPSTAPNLQFPVSYRQVWLRSASGVTGAPGVGMYTKQ